MKPEPERPAFSRLDIIKMNSTFLECEDGSFERKGVGAFGTLLVVGVYSMVMWLLISIMPKDLTSSAPGIVLLIVNCSIALLVSLLALFFLWRIDRSKGDYFGYTHYPTRFNRKNQKVYSFQRNGTVMVEDWDKIDLRISANQFEMKIVMTSEDGKTELGRIFEPVSNAQYSQWAFIRFYMEEPEKLPYLAQQVEAVLDIADRKAYFSRKPKARRKSFNLYDSLLSLALFLLVSPLFLLALPLFVFRLFAIFTCSIPRWPAEVEAECWIEPNDPWLRDRDHLAAPGTVERPPLPK
jgi:hypothetical protein